MPKRIQTAFRFVIKDLEARFEELDKESKKRISITMAEELREWAEVYIDRPRPETLAAIVAVTRGNYGVQVKGKAVEWLRKVIEGYTVKNAYIPVVGNVVFDRYGNETIGQMKRILRDPDVFKLRSSKNGLPRGIYERNGRRLEKKYKYVKRRKKPSIFPYDQLALDSFEYAFGLEIDYLLSQTLDGFEGSQNISIDVDI